MIPQATIDTAKRRGQHSLCVKGDDLLELIEENARQRKALQMARSILDGLSCTACKKRGAELADGCCRDADCDAGFNGINADQVKWALDAINQTSVHEREKEDAR